MNLNRLTRFLFSPYCAAMLIALAYLMAISAAAHKSVTFDEVAGIIGGYSIWQQDDFRMLPDNGTLHQRLAGFPSLWRNDRFPDMTQESWQKSDLYIVSDQLLFQLGNDADGIVFSSRAMVALVLVAVGIVIYFWSRYLYGPQGALVSLVLFAFCPTLLGHGPLVVSDTTLSLFYLLAMTALWRMLQKVDWLTVLLASVTLAGVFLAKVSGVMILPMGVALLLLRLCNPDPLPVQFLKNPVRGFWKKLGVFIGTIPVMMVIVWLCIWAAFNFRYSAFSTQDFIHNRLFPGGWEFALAQKGFVREIVSFMRIGQWFPESFLYGIQITANTISARQSFLNGDFDIHGFRTFFPYAFAVKETIPYLIVLGLAVAAAVMGFLEARKRSTREGWSHIQQRFFKAAPLLVLVIVYAVFAIMSKLNIGHRHLFPLYPPLFILAGAAASWFNRRTLWVGVAVGVMLVWHVGESLAVRPNYLTYFNEFAGGPANGYKHLVDSSLDWGQDLPALKDWLHEHQYEDGKTPVYLLYFGTGRPGYYKIQATLLPGFLDRTPPGPIEPLKPGIYAISATHYQGVYLMAYGPWTERFEQAYQAQRQIIGQLAAAQGKPEEMKKLEALYTVQGLEGLVYEFPRLRTARLCAWLRAQNRKPDALINNSILIFNLSAADLRAALEPAPVSQR